MGQAFATSLTPSLATMRCDLFPGIVGAGVAGVILFTGLTFAALSISKRSLKPKQHMEPLTTQQEVSLDSPEMNDTGEEESNEANLS